MVVNHRPPPQQLSNTQLNQVTSWCRYDPLICVREVLVETLFVAAGYCSILYLTGSAVPAPQVVLKFMAVFTTLSLASRMISDDLGNKLSITAVSGIGAKAVSIMAPRFVGW